MINELFETSAAVEVPTATAAEPSPTHYPFPPEAEPPKPTHTQLPTAPVAPSVGAASMPDPLVAAQSTVDTGEAHASGPPTSDPVVMDVLANLDANAVKQERSIVAVAVNTHGHEPANEPLAFWLASYPRSGNTLARIMLSQSLLPAEQQDLLDVNFPSVDIEQSTKDQAERKSIKESVKTKLLLQSGARFGTGGNQVRFVKTHWCSPEVMDLMPSRGAAYFVRHPVDVFLSGLNYMYVNAVHQLSFQQYFIDQKPRLVTEIAECGELEHYVDDFVENSGFWPFEFGSGNWTASVRNWLSASGAQNVHIFTYSRLVNSRADVLKEILQAAGLPITNEQLNQGVVGSEEATKPDGKFYWRGGGNVKSKYLLPEHVAKIEAALLKSTGLDLSSM